MVLGDIITITQAAKTGVECVRDWQDDHRDIEAFDAFEQRFIDTLETSLEKLAASSTFNCPMDEILDRYDDNRKQILEQVAEEDVVNEQRALDTLVEQMVTVVVEELDEDIDQQELEKAVRVAYRETLEKFISDASADDQLQLRMARDIQEDVDTILEELTTWKQQLNPRPGFVGRQERFRLVYPSKDADWAEVLETELGVEEGREELEFLPPDGFSSVTGPGTERVLLAGRKGSGKSRTLFEGVVELVSAVKFDRVVQITGPVAETSDLSKAFQDVDGNALLVLDDLQKNVKKNFDFEDALTELEQRVNPEDLYVRAATRSEDLDTVLPDNYGLNNLAGRRARGDMHEQWTAFHPEHLPPLEGKRLEQFVEAALKFEDVTAPAELREEFVEAVLERDPTPFYVTSVCANAGDRLTQNDLDNLPENAVNAWYNAYDRLGRDQQTLLENIFLLDLLEVPKRVRVIEAIYESEVFSGKDCVNVITDLDMKGWLSERGGQRESQIVIHDIRLEAIDRQLAGEEGTYMSVQDFVDRKIFFDFSDFLIENRLVERLPEDLGALLNVNFAEYVYENGIGTYPVEDAQRHFERAINIVRESPQIYAAYADFLGKGHAEDGEIIELYEEAINQVSSDPSLYKTFANIIKERGDGEQAREVLEEGLEHTPGDRWMRYDLALMWKRVGTFEKAIEVLEEGLEHAPGDSWMRSELVELCGQEQNLKMAIEVLEEGLEHAPGDHGMRIKLARLWDREGDHEKSIEVLEEGLEHAPGDHGMRSELAGLWDREDELEKAIKELEDGLKHAPDDHRMRIKLARLWDREGDHEKTMEMLEKGLEHAPGDLATRSELARLWKQGGNLEKAIEVLEEGLEHATGDLATRRELARLWKQGGNLEKAIEIYEEGLEYTPGDYGMRSELAELWDREGDLAEAIEILEEGLKHSPSDFRMRGKLAEFWEREGDFEKAIEVLEEGLQYAPGNYGMHSELARLWEQEGDLEKAIEILERGLEHAPGDSGMRCELAGLWERKGNRKKAMEVLEEGLEHAPGDSGMRGKLAELWEGKGDLKKAMEVLEEGLEHAPDDIWMRRDVAELLEQEGNLEKAIEVLEEGAERVHVPASYGIHSKLAALLAEYYNLREAIDRYRLIVNSPLSESISQAEFAEMLESQEMTEEANAVREMVE